MILGLVAASCVGASCFAGELTRADREQLLAGRAGFGMAVTGGLDGPTVHVTTDADAGPGSLRQAVAGDEAKWVVFDGDYTIHFTKGIMVGSNTTIDGRGHKVTLTGHGTYGLIMSTGKVSKAMEQRDKPVTNVIIENLILHDFGDIAKTEDNDPFDAINLGGGLTGEPTDRIWIDHCDLSVAGDKLIGITGGATNITVSWSHFHDQQQTFQIGAMATQAKDVVSTVTVHHNFFDKTGYRNPVVSYGKLHTYNNYIVGWKVYGMRSEHVAQAYVENNIFEAGESPRATLVKPAGKGFNDKHTLQDDRPGFLKLVGNLAVNGAKFIDNEPEKVFDPSQFYRYTAEPATPELAKRIAADAGWKPAEFFATKSEK